MSGFKKGQILNYLYTGGVQSINLPAGEYKLECWGAEGGSYSIYLGGKGGYSTGTLTLNEPTQIYIYTGGKGQTPTKAGLLAGGFNGGGAAYSSTSSRPNASGGGASDIRLKQANLYARVIVAGGGGGGGFYSSSRNGTGGYGGGIQGGNGSSTYSSLMPGTGAGQTVAGTSYSGTTANSTTASYGQIASFGQGGSATSKTTAQISGAGGGWYGGGYAKYAGAGGGSGYIYTSNTASNYPEGCLLNETYYLSNASIIAGNNEITSPEGETEIGHSGDGYIRITILKIKGDFSISPKVNGIYNTAIGTWTKINGVWKNVPVVSIKYGDIWHSSGQGGAITPDPSGQTLGNLTEGTLPSTTTIGDNNLIS